MTLNCKQSLVKAHSERYIHCLLTTPFHSTVFRNTCFHGVNLLTQVRLCRFKSTGDVFAMKKLKKSEMLSRGQVNVDEEISDHQSKCC